MIHPDTKLVWIGEGGLWLFWCPGCNTHHNIIPKGETGKGPRWKIVSVMPLSVEPSVLTIGEQAGEQFRCHLFIRGNKLQYLNDCTHHLAGQTVQMIEVETR